MRYKPTNNDFIARSLAQRQLIFADLNNISEVLLTGPGGTGKTISLLISSMGPQKDGSFLTDNPNYVGLILRREGTQLEKSGLIRSALEWYKKFYKTVEYNGALKRVTFPSGAVISFGGCEMEDDALKYKGFSKLHFLGLEEGTQFTQRQLDILTTRLRDADNEIPLRVRISTNAGENEEPLLERYKYWLWQSCVEYLEPSIKKQYGEVLYRYIDEEDPNYPIVITENIPDRPHETFMCIATKVDDIMKNNVQILGKISDPVLREQLLNHKWGLKVGSGMYFKENELFISEHKAINAVRVRYWDKACSGPKGDYLAGALIARYTKDGVDKFLVEDLVLVKPEVSEVENIIHKTAQEDGKSVFISIEQEGASAGKEISEIYKEKLQKKGFRVFIDLKKGMSKIERASLVSPLCKQNQLGYMQTSSTKEMINQLINFPTKGISDDAVDAICNGIYILKEKLPRPSDKVVTKTVRPYRSLEELMNTPAVFR